MHNQHTAVVPTRWSNLFGLKQFAFALAFVTMLLFALFPYTVFGQQTADSLGDTREYNTTSEESEETTNEVGHPDIPESMDGYVSGGYVFDDAYKQELDALLDKGIPGDQIKFNYKGVGVPLDANLSKEEYILNECKKEQVDYLSARSCRVTCELDSGDWAMGDQCGEDDAIVGYAYAYVESTLDYGLDTCFAEGESQDKTAAELCAEAQAPYEEWIPVQGNENSWRCKQPEGGSGNGYCFRYDERQGIDEDDVYVGTGNTCFSKLGRCQMTMIDTYDGIKDVNFDTANPDYCRARTNDAGETEYCMNDLGLVTDRPGAIADSKRNERIEQYEREQQARREANDARVAADTQTLQESGSLVPCTAWDCGWNELIVLINNVIRFLITVAAVVVVLMIAWAGWKLVSARGNAQALGDAKSALGKAIAGFVLVLTAWLIVDVVARALLSDEFETDSIVNILGDQ